MYFGGIPKMTTLKKLLQNMKSVMQTRSFRQILMLCLMLIGLLVVYFIYVRKYNVNKREGAAGGRPETEKEMNEKVDKYLKVLNACTNLGPNSDEYKLRRGQQEKLAEKIKAGFSEKIDTIKGLKYDKDRMQDVLKGKISTLKGDKKALNGKINDMGGQIGSLKETVTEAEEEKNNVINEYKNKKDNLNVLIAEAMNKLRNNNLQTSPEEPLEEPLVSA